MLRPAGLRMRPIGLVPDDITALSELVEVAPLVAVPTRTSRLCPDPGPDDGDRTVYTNDEDVDAPTRRHVRRIGSARAAGDRVGPDGETDRPGRGGRSTTATTVCSSDRRRPSLIAWLATHRDRATRANARTALWEQDVRDATFANVVSEAQAVAGATRAAPARRGVGRPHVDRVAAAPPARRHRRRPARARSGRIPNAAVPQQAIAILRPAVDSIAGLPFEGTSYLWPDAEGMTSHLILLATSAASELAAHCLAVGDIEGVFQATGRGLRVLPGHEELIGLRMRAHARAGDHAGVRQEWNSYERVINADPWSDGEPSPKLVDLRKQLLHPSM